MRAHAMRTLAPALLCLFAAACGGDFSNEDLEFLNALPQREDLAARLPSSKEVTGNGTETRKDALGLQLLGDLSELAGDTFKQGTQFNQSVDALLTLLEAIRSRQPTVREPHRRVWGPFSDKDRRGNDVRFVMERDADAFTYSLQYRPSGTGDDQWWTFLPGRFQANGGIRKGEGSVALDLKEARAHGFLLRDMALMDRLDIGYQTKALPTRVELAFTAVGRTQPGTRYTYRAVPNGPGEMVFRLADTDLVPGGLRETLDLTSRWAPDGRGMVSVDIVEGDAKGAKYTECWDISAHTTFIQRNWDWFNPPEGDPKSCPDFSELNP
ncbi:hypothetical protein DRW03_23470 [Corallococcus sp. H22C18031201]|nr:hypothetical protein DRW03_23470 [Corallococcus sp. H22C18031201]